MNWTELLEIATDFLRYGGALVFLLAIGGLMVLAVMATATPEHRSRYESLEDEAGDTHTSWDLHRAEIPRRPLQPTSTPSPRRRVRAGGPVLTPSYDSRKHATPAAPDSFRT